MRAEADSRFPRIRLDHKRYPEVKDKDFPDYVSMAVWYCQEVVGRRVPACYEEMLACQRFLTMKQKAEKPGSEYYWSDANVVDVCDFCEKLPHVKAYEGTITLEPVQCWWIANIFGFRERGTGLRWIRSVSFWVPRKNAKSTLSVGILLYCLLCEGEIGAEATISAGSEDQARIPYNMIRSTFKKLPELAEYYGAHHTMDYTEFRKAGDAKIQLATAKAKNLDGQSPHVVLAEELHAQSQEVIGVLTTAMGSRRAPLWLSISTAGRDTNSPAYDDWKMCLAILKGTLTAADRTFVAVYTASKEDAEKRFDLKVIERVNPLWGVSLRPASIEREKLEALKSPSALNEYLRTRLNVWSRAAGNLIDITAWDKCADPKLDLDVFKGMPLFVGIDLASRSDLNAASYMTEVGETVYAASDYWLPGGARRMEDDRFAPSFVEWAKNGFLKLTDGTFIDGRIILQDVLAKLKGHMVIGVGLDGYQGDLFGQFVEELGYPVFIIPKTAKFLTQATDDLISRVSDPKLFQHDANPVSRWCAGNTVGHYDANSNVLPKKEKPNSAANIDGTDSLINANALRLDWKAGILGRDKDSKTKPSPYNARGLLGAA